MRPWLIAVVLMQGCVLSSAPSMVLDQFTSQFDCKVSESHDTPDGWRVEGCGTEAFYHCSLTPAPALGQSCFLVLQRPMTAERQQDMSEQLQQIIASTDGKEPAATAAYGGGVLMAHTPRQQPDFVVLTVVSKQPLTLTEDCPISLLNDDRRLTIAARRQRDPRHAQLLALRQDLTDLIWSKRFGGEVCGVPVALDKHARKKLARLER